MRETPTKFGRYRVLEQLGAGAMGAVFLAHDQRLDRNVAVKAIHTVGIGDFQREVFESRFNNEARALAALSHPNIVPVFDMGIEGDVPYLVMEHIAGRSLAGRLEIDGTISPAEARALVLQLASALGEAHRRDILHRDIKPANVLESDSGGWKLADFGIAHTPGSDLTLTGQFLGSPAYAAPEALQRGEFSPASDVYSLAATVYECLVAQPPFGERGLLTEGALTQANEAVDVRSQRPDVPADLAQLLMACLRRDPATRPTVASLIQGLSGPRAVTAAPGAPVPVVHASPSHVRTLIIAGVCLAMLVGITIGVMASGDDGAKAATRSAAVAGDEPADATPGPSDDARPYERSAKTAKHWRKAQEKTARGDIRGALKELDRLLDRDPNDYEAHALREHLRHQPARKRRHKRRPKHKRKRHRDDD